MTATMKFLRAARVIAALVAAAIALDAAAQQTPTRPGRRSPQLQEKSDNPRAAGNQGLQSAEPSDREGRPSIPRASGSVEVSVSEGAASESPSRVTAPQGKFDPFLWRTLEYGDPPPSPADAKISLTGPMSGNEFLDALSLATGWNIISTPNVKTLILEFWANEISPTQALAILRFNEVFYEYDPADAFLYVSTKAEYLEREYGSLVQADFSVRYADMESVETVLKSLLSAKGWLIVDPATSKVIVYDTKDNIEAMRKVSGEIDAPQETRAIQLVHVDAEAIAESVGALLTESGKLSVDARSNTLVVYDRPQRIERIQEVVAMLDQELLTRSWVLDYADPITVAEDIGVLVPEAMGSIVVHEDTHQITVTATPYRLNEINDRIGVWDTKRRQVQIEAYLVTAGQNILRDLNINWSYSTTVGQDSLDFTIGSIPTGDDAPAAAGTTVNFQGTPLAVLINMLDTSDEATILAHPRITVQDGMEASFDNTTQVPFASSTTTFNTGVNGVSSNAQIDFIDVGTRLLVTPRITSDASVLLDIEAEDSTFVSVNIFSDGKENTLPQKTQNRAQTQVLVRDQETIVLGGMRTSNFASKVDRVPILGDLPLIGRAFRSTSKDHQDRELLIFLTPTIVGEETQPESSKLAAVDDKLAGTMRLDDKTTLGRLAHKLDKGAHEFTVSIGQTGGLLAEGEAVTIEELHRMIDSLSRPENKTMVVREHPRAPKEVGSQITDAALERGMKVEFDTRRFPFVPRNQKPATASETLPSP